jgi:signal transduction histidine kinase
MEAAAGTARDLQRLSSQIIRAQEDERRTIARELHDEVGQVLTAIKMELATAERAIAGGSPAADVLLPARTIADGALQTIRDLSRLLHPTILDDLGLPAAVELYLKEFGTRNGLTVTFTHEGMGDRLGAETEAAAYRIVQEAITNVLKHARASACIVQLQRLPNTLLIMVEDNGVGFDPQEAGREGAPDGLGLISIRERVGHLRGTLRIESAPGRGTRLTAVLATPPRPDEETA